MGELFVSSLPFQAVVLVMALLLCLAPHLSGKGRGVMAGAALLAAIVVALDVLVLDHDHELTLEVPNVFARGPEPKPHLWVVDTVTAPSWHYHVVVIALFLVPAAMLWLLRRRPPGSPHPLLFATLVFWFFAGGRLLLEATAAHRAIVWAFGGTVVLAVVLPFFGLWCARRGTSVGRFLAMLPLLTLLQRLPLVAFGYFATTRQLGTHLDTHVVTEVTLAPIGEIALTNDFERWLWLQLVPQTTVWVVITVLFGSLLGILPFWLGRNRGAAATS